MPTYGYQCSACNHTFEVMQKIMDEPLKECGKCGGEVKRLLYPVGVVFKGSGFHINDYRKPDKSDGNGEKKNESPACKECPSAKACESSSS